MASGPRRAAKSGRKPARGKKRSGKTPTPGARLDAALSGGRAMLSGAAAALAGVFAGRRLAFIGVSLAALLVLGAAGGLWLTSLFDAPAVRTAATAPPRGAAPAPRAATKPPAEPKYARIDDLPDLPKYSEAEGKARPVFEERVAAVPPARRLSGDATWQRNAVPFRDDRARPVVVIVIDDMGVDRARSRRVTELPGPLTLSYLPYARDLREQAQAARGRGHELMLHLPMEPLSSSADPGPNALLTTLAEDAIRRRTIAALDSFGGYVAVNNHMGSRFTTWRPGVEIALREMKSRGLAWLDSRTSAHSVGGLVADELGLPFVDRHVFLDDVDSVENVRAQLAEAERVARRQGFAIAIGHPHDATIQALAEWLPSVAGKGLQLGPVSAALRRRGGWE
ncbi:MAG: divergent polysaccharide deacetylase family protein [Rhodospirillales bacterium]|nr:MAG: divergent polysaccharide deacetylase family protein [Rhodospirillales bacterium]